MAIRGTGRPSGPASEKGEHADRKVVDLLFFPTGGGKTEAYLGLAAFTMVLRRLRDPSIGSAGLSVLMRYTLRLLTLDQLGRAATLICALELERQKDVERLGRWPFEIAGSIFGLAAYPGLVTVFEHVLLKNKRRYTGNARHVALGTDATRAVTFIALIGDLGELGAGGRTEQYDAANNDTEFLASIFVNQQHVAPSHGRPPSSNIAIGIIRVVARCSTYVHAPKLQSTITNDGNMPVQIHCTLNTKRKKRTTID